jgi:AcrR family transcriptional regulator
VENTGLRARKKERTRAAITRAALELFARDGFAATTLAAIADAAEVSPRTVSTYFPSKELLVFGAYPEAIARLRERISAREPGANVLTTVTQWLRAEEGLQDEVARAAVTARPADGTDFARLRQQAIANDPDLWALERRHVRELSDMLTQAFAEELGEAEGSLLARIAGETTAVALMEANARAARGDESLAELLELALGFIDGGVCAVRCPI